MQKRVIIVLAAVFFYAASWAQESKVLNTVSPKLRKLLTEQPQALEKLTNALSHTFSGKSIRLFYFYSNDESEPRAFHYYPKTVGLADVVICIRENQHPLDEFITILYETVNAKGESRFLKLGEDAWAGTISRTEFTREILKTELESTKTTRDLLGDLKVSTEEKAESYYYRRFAECPDDFDAFLSYIKRVSPHRDAVREYELKYDALRKKK